VKATAAFISSRRVSANTVQNRQRVIFGYAPPSHFVFTFFAADTAEHFVFAFFPRGQFSRPYFVFAFFLDEHSEAFRFRIFSATSFQVLNRLPVEIKKRTSI
jgi:hypothetical protein